MVTSWYSLSFVSLLLILDRKKKEELHYVPQCHENRVGHLLTAVLTDRKQKEGQVHQVHNDKQQNITEVQN